MVATRLIKAGSQFGVSSHTTGESLMVYCSDIYLVFGKGGDNNRNIKIKIEINQSYLLVVIQLGSHCIGTVLYPVSFKIEKSNTNESNMCEALQERNISTIFKSVAELNL